MILMPSNNKTPLIVMAGQRGAKGDSGQSDILTAIAGEPISALKAVYLKEQRAYQLSQLDEDNIYYLAGIAINGANKDDTVQIQRYGQLTDSAFNFQLGRVYLGANGSLTQTPVNTGFDVLIGTAIAQHTVLLNIQDIIEL